MSQVINKSNTDIVNNINKALQLQSLGKIAEWRDKVYFDGVWEMFVYVDRTGRIGYFVSYYKNGSVRCTTILPYIDFNGAVAFSNSASFNIKGVLQEKIISITNKFKKSLSRGELV